MRKRVRKKILVTGARGMLGCHLVPHLRACGHEVVELSRTGRSSLCADLTDGEQGRAVLDEASPEIIVNLAALTDVDECERNPQRAYLTNVRIVENLTNWIRKYGSCRHLVQISTDQVYDGIGSHKEEGVTLTNYYGFSKYAGELAAAAVPSTILRTNFFGPSQCPSRVSLSDWLVRSLSRGESITVFEDVYFSPLCMQRLAEQLELVIGNPQPGVFNLGSRDGMSKADFAFMLAAVMDLPTQTMRRGSSTGSKTIAYRPKDMRMDSSRYEKVFGIQLPSLREEIRSMKAGYVNKAG